MAFRGLVQSVDSERNTKVRSRVRRNAKDAQYQLIGDPGDVQYLPENGEELAIERAAQEKVDYRNERLTESRVICTVMVLLSSVAFAYYVGVVWLDTLFFYGYPRFGTPPSPNTFVKTRYGGQWIFTYFLSTNALPPVFLAVACAMEKRVTGAFLHFAATALAGISSFVVAVYYLLVLWLDTNGPGTGYSFSNDYRWCGVYYADIPEVCANTTPFVPPVTAADLSINDEFLQHIIFAWGFVILAFLQVSVASLLRRWRLWETI